MIPYFTLRMVEKGILQLDTPLYKYLPPQDTHKGIPVYAVIDKLMTKGMP